MKVADKIKFKLTILVIVLILLITSCSIKENKRVLVVNLKNGSDAQKKAYLSIKIDNNSWFDGIVSYDGVPDRYTVFATTVDNKQINFRAKELFSELSLDSIISLKEDTTYIFLTYLYSNYEELKYNTSLDEFDTMKIETRRRLKFYMPE